MKYTFWVILVAIGCLALMVAGFWVSYPVWWKGLRGPNYEFLTGLLGNAVVSVLDILVVTLCIGAILRRREDMRWRYSRSRFLIKFLQELNTVLIFARGRVATEVQSQGVKERLLPNAQRLLDQNFDTISADTFSLTMKDALASMESLIDSYAAALNADIIDFALRLITDVETLRSTSEGVGLGTARVANAETFRLSILEPASLMLSTILHAEVLVDEELPMKLQEYATGFAAVHTKILTALIADLSRVVVSINDDTPLDLPQLRNEFRPAL